MPNNGDVTCVDNSPVVFASHKQQLLAESTTEAELYGLSIRQLEIIRNANNVAPK